MPGLKCFGRRWKVGSDDFVYPGIIEISLRIIWLTAICSILHVYHNAFVCGGGELLWKYHIGLITLISLGMVITAVMTLVSSQGSIMNGRPRRSIPVILYIKLALAVPELAWNCLGTYWAFSESSGCDWKVVATVKGAVLFGWIVVVLALIGLFMLLDPMGEQKQRDSSIASKDSFLQSAHSSAKTVWERRCRLVCCCMRFDKHNADAFTEIAKVIANFFLNVDLVPTDIAAGLILMHSQHNTGMVVLVDMPSTSFNQMTVSHASNSTVTETSETHVVSAPADCLIPAFSNGARLTHKERSDSTGSLDRSPRPIQPIVQNVTLPSACLSTSDCPQPPVLPQIAPKPWMTVELMHHYMKYAAGSYGWPLYMFMNLCTGMCRLYGQCRCCSCKNTATNSHDNSCQCNTAALKKMTGLQDEDLVYVSYHNDVYEIPFYVAIDKEHENVVVAIRGTLSLKDALTDMSCDTDVLDVADVEANTYAHKGILSAAIYIKNTLSSKHILESAFLHGQDYGLVITGHSLGAGAAALLAILLHPQYPHLKCLAFSPPGGLISPNLMRHSQEFTCSVILGKDIIPRMSMSAMFGLKVELLKRLQQCTVPKYKILLGGCSKALCGVDLNKCHMCEGARQPLLSGPTNITRQYSSSEEGTHDMPPPGRYPPLHPPGLILHVTRVKQPKSLHKKTPQHTALWVSAERFTHILISPRMISDHIPDSVLGALGDLAKNNFSLCAVLSDVITEIV